MKNKSEQEETYAHPLLPQDLIGKVTMLSQMNKFRLETRKVFIRTKMLKLYWSTIYRLDHRTDKLFRSCTISYAITLV